MDVVEVSPPYDWAESTAQLANRVCLEAISALAAKRLDGGAIRHPAAAAADPLPAGAPRVAAGR
jgi:agmatinase